MNAYCAYLYACSLKKGPMQFRVSLHGFISTTFFIQNPSNVHFFVLIY